MMNGFVLKIACLVLALGLVLLPQRAMANDEEIIINGSSTVNNFVFYHHKEEIAQKTGIAFALYPTSSGRGIIALVEGQADMAMISSDFESLSEKLRATEQLQIKEDEYEVHTISEIEVLFIVHPDNPVRSLSKQQVKDLFTGKIKDWGAIKGAHPGPVKIITEHHTGGIYNTVLDQVTDKEPITEDKIEMQNGPQTALVVSQVPGGFAMLSAATPKEQRHNIIVLETPALKAVQRMYFVTKKGENRKNVFKIIHTIQEEFSR